MKTSKRQLSQQIKIDSDYLHLYLEFEKYITERVLSTAKISNSPQDWILFKKGLLRWKKIFMTGSLNVELSETELKSFTIKVGKKYIDPFTE